MVSVSSATTMSAQWDPPARMNGKLKKYTVFYSGTYGNGGRVTSNTEETTLSDLRACSEYTVTVTATNGAEESEPSDPTNGVTDAEGEAV